MHVWDIEAIQTHAVAIEAITARQSPTCDIVYDRMHDASYCRVCEIGHLTDLIKHELEQLDGT